jgi:subtilase family protein
MRMRLCLCFIAVAVLVSISTVGSVGIASRASNVTATPSAKRMSAYGGASISARSYRSPGMLHKLIVPNDDTYALIQARAEGAVEISDYGSFTVFAIDDGALQKTEAAMNEEPAGRPVDSATARLSVRDDFNLLLLRAGAIDTTDPETTGTFVGMGRSGESYGLQSIASSSSATDRVSQLRLIQFVGPVKRAWIEQLQASGLDLVAYVPNNAYLARGDRNALARLMARNQSAEARGEGFVQWQGPFLDDYKLHPALAAKADAGELTVAVQFALGRAESDSRNNAEVKQARKLASSVMVDAYSVANFTTLRMRIDASRLAELAGLPGVVNIEPWTPPQLLDERASQIVAGQLTADRTTPRGPGYVAWLAAHGFSSNFNFAIDVADTGIDRGAITAGKLHPDFLDSSQQSRVLYARDYTSEADPGDIPGHGTLNMSIAAGGNTSAATGARDSAGYNYGLGVAPFALLGASKIFQSNSNFDLIDPYTKLVSDAYHDGARVCSNSWGAASNFYSIDSAEYDLRVRDATPDQPGNQEISICFAAGNVGAAKAISEPSTGKNVISVAAGESSRKDGLDGCDVGNTDADNAMDIAFFSSSGPAEDGRIKPDITAPGTHIEGAASQNADFDGSGVCGQDFLKPYFPVGQTLYTWSSGTSHSTPQVAGAAALVRQFLINRGEQPNAALIKALMLNTTTYMTGARAGGNLPQAAQGWGLLNLDRAFDSTPRIFVNQTNIFTDSGQEFVFTGEVKDATQPFRVTLAWTDAPGFSGVAPWVNNLDLEVTINGQVYRGNNFLGQDSQPGGDADTKNNVEGVWLPAGTIGTFIVRVRASNIAGDGVPGNADPTDQDFALVVYNGEKKDVPVATLSGRTISAGSDNVVDPGESVSMTVSVGDLSPFVLIGAHGTLSTTTTGVTVTGSATDFPNIASGQNAGGSTPFAFTVDKTVACGATLNFMLEIASQSSLSRIPFTVQVGTAQSIDFFFDGVEAGESKWTHGSGIQKKKFRVDTWMQSGKRVRSGAKSWFTSDPGDKVIDAHLDTVPIQLPTDLHNLQLVFYHTFEFERGTFDGGVLEISTGGDFEDLGAKILKGGYTGTVYRFFRNPLANRPAWTDGRLAAFQQVVVDLSSYAGKTVTIRFRIGTDDTGKGLGWYIDDVSIRGDRVSCTPVSVEQ